MKGKKSEVNLSENQIAATGSGNEADIQMEVTTDEEDFKKKNAHNTRFLEAFDLKGLTDVFNSYATKKTYATGFFNLALVATNFAQMKQLVTTGKPYTPLNIVLLTFVSLSLLLQFVVAVVLVFLARQGEFIDEEKRNQLIRSNNGVTILVLIVSIINIFINVFISV